MQTATTIEERINKACEGPLLDLVRSEQQSNPQNRKLVVKIGDLNKIRQMLVQAHLCEEASENMDYVHGKVIELLNRQCLGSAKEFARSRRVAQAPASAGS